MDKSQNLALILQMIESAEKNLQSARQLLRENGAVSTGQGLASPNNFNDKASTLAVMEGGKIIEGVFDGQNMIGPDTKQYPVPANYASKSKLVEGDVLKLTIADDGSFIYKQIGPIERKKIIGLLMQDENGDYRVLAEGKSFRVLLASLTYFKAEPGDEVTIVVPEEGESQWAAVENVIKAGSSIPAGDVEMDQSVIQNTSHYSQEDEDEAMDRITAHEDEAQEENNVQTGPVVDSVDHSSQTDNSQSEISPDEEVFSPKSEDEENHQSPKSTTNEEF